MQMLATVRLKGQVSIPASLRRVLGVQPGDKVAFLVRDGEVRLTRATSVVKMTAGMLRGGPPMLSPAEEGSAIEAAWADLESTQELRTWVGNRLIAYRGSRLRGSDGCLLG